MFTKRLLVPLLSATAITGYAASAHAVDEYVLILLDQTGSMCDDTTPCRANFSWHNAINDANLWINDDSADTTTQRFYAIWTFKNDSMTGGIQTGAKLLWPSPTLATDCPAGSTGAIGTQVTINSESTFCKVRTGAQAATAYSRMQGVVSSVETMVGQIPDPFWHTPLADSLCRSLSNVWASNTNVNRTLILESDGGEDFSAEACLGTGSTASVNDFATLTANKTAGVADWGFTLDSWQAKIFRRATRLNSFNSGPPYASAEKSAIDQGALGKTDGLPPQLTMKVSPNYQLCSPTDTTPMCVISGGSALTAMRTLSAAAATGRVADGQASALAAARTVSLAGAAPATAAATGTTHLSIKATELGFFRALGQSTPKSKVREVVTNTAVTYGTTHRIAGDVDDSNCVDMADYKIIIQKGVWMQRAVQPNQLAIRADVTKDGWVNADDRALVVAPGMWGKGCINNPGPPPKF